MQSKNWNQRKQKIIDIFHCEKDKTLFCFWFFFFSRVWTFLLAFYRWLSNNSIENDTTMDFQSAMETFAEAWVAANAGAQVICHLICWNSKRFSILNWLASNAEIHFHFQPFDVRFDFNAIFLFATLEKSQENFTSLFDHQAFLSIPFIRLFVCRFFKIREEETIFSFNWFVKMQWTQTMINGMNRKISFKHFSARFE